jgi:hypothetical protein
MAVEFDSIAADVFADVAVPFGDTVTFSDLATPTAHTLSLTAICGPPREDILDQYALRDVMLCRCLKSAFTTGGLTPVRGHTITVASVAWIIREINLEHGWYVFLLEKDIRVVPR